MLSERSTFRVRSKIEKQMSTLYESDYQDMLKFVTEHDPALARYLPPHAPELPKRRARETVIASIVLSRRISFAASRRIRARLFAIVGDEIGGVDLEEHRAKIISDCGKGTWRRLQELMKSNFMVKGAWTRKAVELTMAMHDGRYLTMPVQWLHVEDKWIQRNLRTMDVDCKDWQARLSALAPYTNLFIWTLWRCKFERL